MPTGVLAILSTVLCLAGALVSIVLEQTHWFGIDAGTSWTIVFPIGCLLALDHGILAPRRERRLRSVLLGAALITGVVLAIVAGGFAIQTMGIPMRWRPPKVLGSLSLVPVFAFLGFAALVTLGIAARFVLDALTGKVAGVPTLP